MKKFVPLQVLLALFLMVLPATATPYGDHSSCNPSLGDCYTQDDCVNAGGYWCPEGYCSVVPCQDDQQGDDDAGDLYGDYGYPSCSPGMGDCSTRNECEQAGGYWCPEGYCSVVPCQDDQQGDDWDDYSDWDNNGQPCDPMMGNCYSKEDCESAGGYWCSTGTSEDDGYCSIMSCQDTASNDNETSNTNEDTSSNGTYQPLPQSQVIGMANPTSAPAKVVRMMGRPFSSISFKYQQPVDILAGFASCDFNKMYWLNPSSCNMGEAFSWSARKKVLSCPLVPLPEDNGYLFWLVSPVEIINLDFSNGAYLLQFLPVGNCQ